MEKYTHTTWMVVVGLLFVSWCVNSQSTNPGDEKGTAWRRASSRQGEAPSWFKMADQYMSGWMSDFMAPKKNGTSGNGGFFATLMDGIVSFSNEIAQKYQNYTKNNNTMKGDKKKKDKTGTNWLNNWRNKDTSNSNGLNTEGAI